MNPKPLPYLLSLTVLLQTPALYANVFEQLIDVEKERSTADTERKSISKDLPGIDRALVTLAESADAARRAAKPVQRQTWQALIDLEHFTRNTQRASTNNPQQRHDAQHLVLAAVPKAIPKQIATLKAIESAGEYVVALEKKVMSRAQISSKLAILSAVVDLKTHERNLLLKGSKLDPQVAKDLQETAHRLASTIAPLPTTSSQVDFHRRKGTLVRPVNAPMTYPFGLQQISDNFSIRNTGQTWKTAKGTPIRATAPGNVLFNDFFPGYGKIIILDHGSGYLSLYAHLDTTSVNVGQSVSRGQNIATSGDSGSLDGDKFYFELRANSKPIDPEPWYLFN